MKEGLQNIGDLIAEPSSAFTRLRAEPRWGVMFLIFFLLSVFLMWVLMPYTAAMMEAQTASTEMTAEQAAAAEQVMRVVQYAGVFIFPIFGIIGLIIYCALIRLVLRFFMKASALRFRHIFAAVLHVSFIGWIVQLVNTVLLLIFKDVADVKSAVDMKMIPGMHHLAGMIAGGDLNPKLAIFLSHLNPLSLWIVAVFAIAVSRMTDIAPARSRVIAVVLWLLGVLMEALPAS